MENLSKLLIAVILTICLVGTADSQQNISRVGNEIVGSRSGVDVKGAIFLISDGALPAGVLYAMRAFFRSDSVVRFQIWRPQIVANSTASASYFRLIKEVKIQPSRVNRVEDIYLEAVDPVNKECVMLKDGDQLGIYMEEAPGSVAYAFDGNTPKALGYTLKNTSIPVELNETVLFDTIAFPYDFSLAAFVHTDMSKYDPNDPTPKCPAGLLIPDEENVTPPPPSQGPMPTGAPGATGPMGPRGFTGPRGYNGSQGDMGYTGATGIQGNPGFQGDDGATGATGAAGPVGSMGYTGPEGPRGEQGPAGPPGPPGPYGTPGTPNAQAVSTFDDPNVVMGLLIWLIILTILLIIFIIITVYLLVERRNNKPKKEIKVSNLDENDINGTVNNHNRLSVHSSYRPEWMSTMKDESIQEVHNSTIDRRDGKSGLDTTMDTEIGSYENQGFDNNKVYDNNENTSDIRIEIPDEPKSPNGSVAKEELTNY